MKEAEIINFSHSGATIEGDSSSGGGIEDSVENFDAAMRGKQVGSYVTSKDAK